MENLRGALTTLVEQYAEDTGHDVVIMDAKEIPGVTNMLQEHYKNTGENLIMDVEEICGCILIKLS